MTRLFFGILLIVSSSTYGQDRLKIEHKIDSIWSIKVRSFCKSFKSEFDSVRYRVCYEIKSKQLIVVQETHYPVVGGLTPWWIYTYHFRNGHLILMTRSNNTNLKDVRHQVAQYYFENDSLVYQNEQGTSIHDIQTEQMKADSLKRKFSWP